MIMKKRYTKKQIMESIAYWKKQLKIGNYRKLNENKYDDGWAFSLYGEMSSSGSYNGLEHWWLAVSEEYIFGTLAQYIKAIRIILNNFESEYVYAYIDPKTKRVVDFENLDYNYLAKQVYDNDEVLIQCSQGYAHSEFNLKNITQDDCDNIIKIHWPDDNEFKRCENDGAMTIMRPINP